MHWRRTTGLALLVAAMAGTASGAERATLADAAERRDRAAVRTLLTGGMDVNARDNLLTVWVLSISLHAAGCGGSICRGGVRRDRVRRSGGRGGCWLRGGRIL